MSERLRTLQRQQALLREHLAWIENEIAQELPATAAPRTAVTTIAPQLTEPQPAPTASTEVDSMADEIIARYAADEHQEPANLRKGCLLLFGAVITLIVAGTIGVWVLYYR